MNKAEIEEHRRRLINLVKEKDITIKELQQRIDKAIEYIKEHSYMVQDKEINGIPLMSQRLDTCDDLLEILGDKE